MLYGPMTEKTNIIDLREASLRLAHKAISSWQLDPAYIYSDWITNNEDSFNKEVIAYRYAGNVIEFRFVDDCNLPCDV